MRNALRSSILALVCSICIGIASIGPVYAHPNPPTSPDYEEAYRALMGLKPDPAQGADVRNLSIQRDVAWFDLHKGELYLLTPIDGRVVGAVFMGEETAYVEPPTTIER